MWESRADIVQTEQKSIRWTLDLLQHQHHKIIVKQNSKQIHHDQFYHFSSYYLKQMFAMTKLAFYVASILTS